LIKEKNSHIKFPQMNCFIKSILLYTEDIKNDLKQKYLKGVKQNENKKN
jgi:hypothetical protein